MKLLARYGKGAFYQTIDSNTLPEIFVEDIKVSTNENSLNEETNFQVGIGPSGLISTSIDKYRPLRGFVETLPKPNSSLELITKSKNQPFPILSSWSYGKGRVIAFTSDANGRWSSPWLSSEYFSIFWSEILQKIQPKENQKDIDFDLRYKIEANKLKLDLSLFEKDSTVTGLINNKKEGLTFNQIAKGKYQSEISVEDAGDYFIDLKVGETKLPEIGISIEELGEAAKKGLNFEYLLKLAKETGGEINPEKIAIKEFKNTETKPLYLPLIIAGFFLVLLEAFVRESRSAKS